MFCNTVMLDRCITHDKNSIEQKMRHLQAATTGNLANTPGLPVGQF